MESGAVTDEMVAWMTAIFTKTDTGYFERRTAPVPMSMRGPVVEHYHSADLLAQITAPVHLFWGTEDPFSGEQSANRFAGGLKNAVVDMVDDAGHAPWLDAPEAAASAVRSHLAA